MKNKIIFKTLMLKGEAGSTIVSMEKTGHVGTADIYTITFNDGSTTEISLENMSAITSVEKTSSTNTEDIYTITCADGSTQTFSVLNHNADIAAMSEDIDTIDARVDNFINSVVPNTVETLWTGSIQEVGDSATLSKAVSNFDYIDLYLLGSSDSKYIRVPSSQASVQIQQQNMSDDASSNFLRLWEMGVSISGTTVSITKSIAWAWDDPDNSNPTVTANAQNAIPITRIDGVKIASDTPAEVTDIRVGANGVTYASAGDAVRGQYNDLKGSLNSVTSAFDTVNLLDDSALSTGYITTDGVEHVSDSYKYTAHIPVEVGDVITVYTFNQLGYNRTAITFRFLCAYDANGNAVSSSGSSSTISSYTVPNGIKSIVCSISASYITSYKVLIAKNGVIPSGYIEYKAKYELINFDSIPQKSRRNSGKMTKTVSVMPAYSEICFPVTNIVKNVIYAFDGCFSEFDKLMIGEGSERLNEMYRSWMTIDSTNVTFGINGNEYEYAHGLTLSGNIKVVLSVNDDSKVNVTIISNGGVYTAVKGWYGFARAVNGYYCNLASKGMTDVTFTVSFRDAIKADTFIFGNSYIAILESTAKWTHWLVYDGYGDNVLINACPGENSTDAFQALVNTFAFLGKPKYLLWCMGMNDGADSGTTPNSTWLEYVGKVIALCEANDVVPVLSTIPTVPSINHEGKNEWVRSSGYKYIDFAKAVGASSNGTWYTDMLSSDNTHPSELGAKALWSRVLCDFPEITM